MYGTGQAWHCPACSRHVCCLEPGLPSVLCTQKGPGYQGKDEVQGIGCHPEFCGLHRIEFSLGLHPQNQPCSARAPAALSFGRSLQSQKWCQFFVSVLSLQEGEKMLTDSHQVKKRKKKIRLRAAMSCYIIHNNPKRHLLQIFYCFELFRLFLVKMTIMLFLGIQF